ncbi:MAG: hypothetical protein GX139_12530 [Armatimonadetes bacterium]|jgi:Mn2+/Fe2+ NRAMP family transporter|nr:hypothetical protein [Armatimonadota bacterium]
MMNDYNRPVKVDIIGGLEDRLMGCIGFILVVGLACVVLQKIVLPILIFVGVLAALAIPFFLWVCCMAYISSRRTGGSKSPFWFLSKQQAAKQVEAIARENYRGNILGIEVMGPLESVNLQYMLTAYVDVKDFTKTAKPKRRVYMCSWSCKWTEECS